MKSRSNSLGVTVLVAVGTMLVTAVVVMHLNGVSILPSIPSDKDRKLGYYQVDGSKEKELLTSLGNPNTPVTDEEAKANGGKRAGAMNWIAVELRYVDPKGTVWIVPKGSPNDGASVPPLLESFVTGGLNTRAKYAAIVHDYYCDILSGHLKAPEGVTLPNATYKEVHEMFYHAMRSSDVDAEMAGIMYTAVEMFGPPKDRRLWTRVLENLTDSESRRLAKALQGEGAPDAALTSAQPETVMITAERPGYIAVRGVKPPSISEASLFSENQAARMERGAPAWTSPNRMLVPTAASPLVVAIDSNWNYTVMHSRPVDFVTTAASAPVEGDPAPKEADQFRKIVEGIKAESEPDLGKVKALIDNHTN